MVDSALNDVVWLAKKHENDEESVEKLRNVYKTLAAMRQLLAQVEMPSWTRNRDMLMVPEGWITKCHSIINSS